MASLSEWVRESWVVMLDLSAWMLLGMAIAGLVHVLLPRDFIRRQFTGASGVLKAVVLGVPLPLCSCGVIPTGLGLKKDGAGDGASVGFLISTPQTGVDSVLVTASFLGWPFALFKVAAAAVTGLVGGFMSDALGSSSATESAASDDEHAADATGSTEDARGWSDGAAHAIDILRTIWRWLLFGVAVSAAITVFLPTDLLGGLGRGGALVAALSALVIALPLYVCATASVPIAAALVAGGLPTGAALVFLMAGPATNVATIGAIGRAFGRRVLAVYLTTIVVGSIAFSWVFERFFGRGGDTAATHVHESGAWWKTVGAVALTGLIAWFAAQDLRRLLSRFASRGAGDRSVEVEVDGMTCNGCVNRLESALRREDGVRTAHVTLDPPRAVVHGPVSEDAIREAIERAGFLAKC
ncbi:MAG: hypothetical protein GY716_07410 [bacterium]|nr:hypothetical protein [bacterium]